MRSKSQRRFRTRGTGSKSSRSHRTSFSVEQLETRQLLAVVEGMDSPAPFATEPAPVERSQFSVEWNGRRVTAVPGEFVFRLDARATPVVPNSWSARSLGTGSWLLAAPGAAESQVRGWAQENKVIDLEPNYLLRPLGTPIDPEYPLQWHLPRINAPQAWDVTTGSAAVIVAVIDSGIDYDHPDFSTAPAVPTPPGFSLDRRNIWKNPSEIPGNGIDDDRNGYTDDVYGYDFGANDSNPMDDDPAPRDREDADIAELGTQGSMNKYTGHGTAVAGVMGAVAGTSPPQQMVAGVNWDLKMMALKITRPGVGYVLSAAVEAYKYIQVMKPTTNIVVANCSWGTYEDGIDIRNLEVEINRAGAQDVLTVAAAGDKGESIDARPFYPAAFPTEYVLSVAATNRDDSLWSGSPDYAWADNDSNWGPRNVDVAAPGKQIQTLISRFAAGTVKGRTGNWEGTSMAAGIVSGLAALMKAASPTAPALALKQVIINTVQPVPQLSGLILSGGIIDAAAAVREIQLPSNPAIDILHLPGQEAGIKEGHSGFTTATWQIRVKGALTDSRVLYVDYRTDVNAGSATPDGRRDPRTFPNPQDRLADYVPVIGTMAFQPGPRIVDRLTQVGRTAVDVGRIRSVPVRVFGDRNVEGSETMRLVIDRAYYRNANGSIELVNPFILTRTNDFVIINDDFSAPDGSNPDARTPLITFVGNAGTASTVEVPEGDTGTSIARFPLRLSIPTTSTVTVQYRTRDLDGRAGVDYVSKTGMVTFRPNETMKFIDIPILGNRRSEGNRSFQVEIFSPTNASLPGTGSSSAGNTATGVIVDDDPLISVVGATIQPGLALVTTTEPQSGTSVLPITLRLSRPVNKQVTVRYATRDLSARAGTDYVATTGTAIIPAGQSSATVNVTIRADTFVEGTEAFFLDLSLPTNAGLATTSVRCEITSGGQSTGGVGVIQVGGGTAGVNRATAASPAVASTVDRGLAFAAYSSTSPSGAVSSTTRRTSSTVPTASVRQ